MKRSFQFILFLTIVILSACNDDVRYDYGNFRMDFVTVLSPEEGIRFLRDDGIVLLSETTNDTDNKYLVTGKRILLRYTAMPCMREYLFQRISNRTIGKDTIDNLHSRREYNVRFTKRTNRIIR